MSNLCFCILYLFSYSVLIRPVRRKYSKDMLCFKFRNKGWQRNQWSWSLYNDGEHSGRGGHDCFDPSNISLEGPGQRKYSAQVKLKRLRSLDAFGKTLICTIALFYDEVSQVYACFRPWVLCTKHLCTPSWSNLLTISRSTLKDFRHFFLGAFWDISHKRYYDKIWTF